MTVSELVAELIERGDEVDNRPMDETEKLVQKVADLADKMGVHAAAIGPGDLTDEERPLFTQAVIERAEREMQKRSERTAARMKQKVVDTLPAEKPAPSGKGQFPILPKKDDGWYFDASAATPDVPEYGPYATKKECEEARASFIRSQRELAKDADKNEAKAKALASGTGAKKKAGKSENQTEPTVATSVTTSIPTEGVTPESESEETMTTKTKKKGGGKPAATKTKAAAANGKPKKAAKENGEGHITCLDAVHRVLAGRKTPLDVEEIVRLMAERKLWSSKKPTVAKNVAYRIGREIAKKKGASRFVEHDGKFSAKG